MGTNFYFIPKMSDEDVQDILLSAKKLAESKDYSDLEKLKHRIHRVVTAIHLGKRSAGWQFLWNHNDLKYYNPDLKSIQKFLQYTEGTIKDDYGQVYTYEEFFKEIKDCLYEDDDHMTAKIFSEKYAEVVLSKEIKTLKVEDKVYNSSRGEFYINDLRFADVTEFC